MKTIDLTEEEITTLRHGLLAAANRYETNATTAREVEREGGIGALGAHVLVEQFTKQAADARTLYVKLMDGDKITIVTTEVPNEG